MTSFTVLKQNDPESAAAEAGEYLNSLLMQNQKSPVLLMLSAGSSLALLDYVGKTALGEFLTISPLDDRFSQDPSVNNFLQLQRSDFYAIAQEAGASFFGTLPRPGEAINDLASRWEKNLREWRLQNPNGKILATVGIGADGHTAGIFPYPEDANKFARLFTSDDWTAAYDAIGKHKYSQRITATLTFFKMIDEAVIFVTGAEKKQKLGDVLACKGEINELPALAWHKIKKATLVTDIK
jgi:6-phosphogluconolactonase/glucosamine-6-phosphate isomerase/deaminase